MCHFYQDDFWNTEKKTPYWPGSFELANILGYRKITESRIHSFCLSRYSYIRESNY
jgi:hypothetical protein